MRCCICQQTDKGKELSLDDIKAQKERAGSQAAEKIRQKIG